MIPNRLLKLTQAILLPAAVILLGCSSNNEKSVSTEQLIDQSKQTLKDVDSELERIKSETEVTAPAVDMAGAAQQPNAIYAKTVFGNFAYENLLVLKLLKEDDKWFLVSDRFIERLTTKTGSEDSVEVPMMAFGLFVSTNDLRGGVGPGMVSGPTKLGTNERIAIKHPIGHLADSAQKQGFLVVAFKAELWAPKESEESHPRFHHGVGMNDLDERKEFVDELQPGKSGEFGGWHYLKVDRTVPEDSGTEE